MVRFASWLKPRPWANSCSSTVDEIVQRPVVVVEPEVEVEVGAEVRVDVVVGGRPDRRPRACSRARRGTTCRATARWGSRGTTGPVRRCRARPAPSGVNCARMRIGTLLSSRALQMLAACCERDQPLLAERRAGVAADRRRRRGIVEPDARRVDVDDDELRRAGADAGRRNSEDERREREQRRASDFEKMVVFMARHPHCADVVFDDAEEFGALFEGEDAAASPTCRRRSAGRAGRRQSRRRDRQLTAPFACVDCCSALGRPLPESRQIRRRLRPLPAASASGPRPTACRRRRRAWP